MREREKCSERLIINGTIDKNNANKCHDVLFIFLCKFFPPSFLRFDWSFVHNLCFYKSFDDFDQRKARRRRRRKIKFISTALGIDSQSFDSVRLSVGAFNYNISSASSNIQLAASIVIHCFCYCFRLVNASLPGSHATFFSLCADT